MLFKIKSFRLPSSSNKYFLKPMAFKNDFFYKYFLNPMAFKNDFFYKCFLKPNCFLEINFNSQSDLQTLKWKFICISHLTAKYICISIYF